MTDRLREAAFGVGGQELDQHARAIGGILLLSGGAPPHRRGRPTYRTRARTDAQAGWRPSLVQDEAQLNATEADIAQTRAAGITIRDQTGGTPAGDARFPNVKMTRRAFESDRPKAAVAERLELAESRRPRAAASWVRIALSRALAVGPVWGTPKGS